MRDVIIKNGGEINNYIGDAILAIFGIKESRQQTLRAANAAVEMLEAMDEFKEYLLKAYGRGFDIRIGVHFGEVILGSVGFGEDKKMTVIGDTVNIASRIEAINKDAGTRFLISDVAYEQIKESVEVRNFVRLKLRGSSNLITLHEVNSVKKNNLIDHSIVKEKEMDGDIWVRTLPISELEQGEKKKIYYGDKEILLINLEGIFAIENICPHMNLPLEIGQITDEGTILCPYHNSEFCFKSGEVRKWVGLQPNEAEKDCEPLKVIPTRQSDSYIWIQKPAN
jgi:nitrite reductase/ring-hydroxylating ferredoxin subunit